MLTLLEKYHNSWFHTHDNNYATQQALSNIKFNQTHKTSNATKMSITSKGFVTP